MSNQHCSIIVAIQLCLCLRFCYSMELKCNICSYCDCMCTDTEIRWACEWQGRPYRHDVTSLCMQIRCTWHGQQWWGMPGCELAAAARRRPVCSLSMDQHGGNSLCCILWCRFCCCYTACCYKRHRYVCFIPDHYPSVFHTSTLRWANCSRVWSVTCIYAACKHSHSLLCQFVQRQAFLSGDCLLINIDKITCLERLRWDFTAILWQCSR